MKWWVIFVALSVGLKANAELIFEDVWSRATPPGMPMGAVYGLIKNSGDSPFELDSVETSVAKLAEIHESVEVDGMMRMREITPFVIPVGGTVELQPGGKHVMLMRLDRSLHAGERFTLTFRGRDGKSHNAEVLVGGFGQMAMPR